MQQRKKDSGPCGVWAQQLFQKLEKFFQNFSKIKIDEKFSRITYALHTRRVSIRGFSSDTQKKGASIASPFEVNEKRRLPETSLFLNEAEKVQNIEKTTHTRPS